MRLGEDANVFEVTLPVYGCPPRTVLVSESGPKHGSVSAVGPSPGRKEGEEIFAAVRRVLRLDEDLSGFYALAAENPDLSWATNGAGRMVRSPTVFEEVVKTLCTTNCAWSATIRMVSALVEHLGEKAPEAPPSGPWGRAFPTPEAMAEAGDEFYKDVVRAGYRGRYMLALARSVAESSVDLEALDAPREELPDDELEKKLLALPGIGPYAAAHVMMMLGRYSRLILDSWTRPKYARLIGRSATDAKIVERFSGYGPYAGLAFWLFLTRGWIEEPEDAPDAAREA
jgi:N-glycosylase/DNA lyase